MARNWKKCLDPKHSRIHSDWFNLDYYSSEYGIYCISDDCAGSKTCCLSEPEDYIGQYLKGTKMYFSTDNGKTKKIVDIDTIPSKIEFITLLTVERIELFGQRTS